MSVTEKNLRRRTLIGSPSTSKNTPSKKWFCPTKAQSHDGEDGEDGLDGHLMPCLKLPKEKECDRCHKMMNGPLKSATRKNEYTFRCGKTN
jgi:hypothetical protein